MSQKLDTSPAVIGIDIGKNSFHIVGQNQRGAVAVQRPTMKFVATKTADQLDLQALHRVRERFVGQRTGIIN